MDSEIPNPPNIAEPEQTQSPLKTLSLLKIGLFEILFVSIALILFFGIMNYFNLLPISILWPKQLGFLPHRAHNKPTSIPQSAQAPTNYSANVFQYDSEKAKTTVSRYIKDSIRPEFIPQNLDIKEGLSIDNRIENNKRQFGSHFTANDATFSINFHYKENTNTPNDFIIFIQPTKIDKTIVTPGLADSLTSSYFTSPYTPITNCNTKGTTSYCEAFKTEDEGKKGYGVVFANNQSKSPPQLTPIVFTCFIPKESNDYTTQTSCIAP